MTPDPKVPAMTDQSGGQVMRPSDDDLLPHLPSSIEAAKRCGIEECEWMPGWFTSWSPRNDNQNAEGVWSDWVALAHEILEADAAAITLATGAAS